MGELAGEEVPHVFELPQSIRRRGLPPDRFADRLLHGIGERRHVA